MLWELYGGVKSGHFTLDITLKKKLDASYWWVTLFRNMLEYSRSRDLCQQLGGLKTMNLV
jgi:hypothetical protein